MSQRQAARSIVSSVPRMKGTTPWLSAPRLDLKTDMSRSHLPHAGLDATRSSTGVVWCTERAAEHGFLSEPDKWANLGRMYQYRIALTT